MEKPDGGASWEELSEAEYRKHVNDICEKKGKSREKLNRYDTTQGEPPSIVPL